MLRHIVGRYSTVLLLPILLAAPGVVEAQGTYSVAGYSMAGAHGTVPRDIDAALVNPALLGLPGSKSFSVRLVSTAVHIDQNLMTLGRYNRWVGAFLDDQEKEEYLNSLGRRGRADLLAEFGTLGLQIGRYSFGFYHVVSGHARVPKDLIELTLVGTRLNKNYDLNEIGATAEAVSVFHGSYAFRFPAAIDSFFKSLPLPIREVYGGVGIKYYAGHAYAGVVDGSMDFILLDNGAMGGGSYHVRSAGIPGESFKDETDDPRIINDRDSELFSGGGIGIDLGIAGIVNDGISFHAGLMNLSPGIRWRNSTYEARFTAEADTIDPGTILLDDEFDIESVDIESLTSYDSEFRVSGAFNSPVPVIFRTGATYRRNKIALNAELEQAFTHGLGYNRVPRLAIGLEYRPINPIPLRAGLSLGGRHGVMGAIGLGLDFKAVVLEIAIANTGLAPGNLRGMGASIGLKVSY